MEFNLNKDNLVKVADSISEKFREFGFYDSVKVAINVDDRTFRKIDEDLYYRNNPDSTEFIPSDDTIIVECENVEIDIIKLEPDVK